MNNYFSKKAEMSLEALLGIILSIMGMVVLITIFSNILFTSQPNQIISQNTVDSFHDYVSFSQQSTYQNIGSCFTTFKIEQLTNYQSDKNDDQNYFFVITQDFVGKVPFIHLEKFQNLDTDAYQYIEQREYFSQSVELKIDKTREESQLLQGLTFGIGGNSDVELVFDEESPNVILLLPTFTNQKKFEVIIPEQRDVRSNQGKDTYTIQEDDFLNSYLAYSPSSNYLFAPKNKMSHFYIQQNLCLKKKRIADYISSITLDEMYKLAHTQYHIIFEITPQTPYSFEWNQGPICKNEGAIISCGDILSSNSLSYEEFLDEIQDYLRTLEGDVSFGVKKYIPIQEYYSDKSVLNDLFSISEEVTLSNYFQEDTSSRSSAGVKNIIKYEYENFYFEEDSGLFSGLFSGIEYDSLIYKDNKVYFLLEEISEEEFVYFNTQYIKSYQTDVNNYIYFFNNQEIEPDNFEFSQDDSSLQVYRFTIEVDGNELDILFSNEQLREIQSRALDASATFIESSEFKLLEYFESIEQQNEGMMIKPKYISKGLYEKEIFGSNQQLARNTYFLENNELYFYDNIINVRNFITFNQDLIRIEIDTNKKYFYFNEEIEFTTKTIEDYSGENEFPIYCFMIRQDVLDEVLEGRGSGEIEICLSEQQFNSIGVSQQ